MLTRTQISTKEAITYKDGTYTAEGTYMTHVGSESIKVTVTIKNNIVTTSDVTPEPADGMSAKYQDVFTQNYKPMVIGKDITTLHLVLESHYLIRHILGSETTL